MAPIRVLWLSKGLGPGGVEKLLVAVARHSDPGEVTYEAAYLLPWKQHLVPDLEAAGVRTHLLDGPREYDARWGLRLRRLLVDGRFDVIHLHAPYPAAVARPVVLTLPRRVRPKIVTTEHNVATSYRWPTRLLNRASWRLDADRLAVAEEVRTSYPRAMAAATTTLIHGIEIDDVRQSLPRRVAMRAELGVADDDVVVCVLANLRADKDYPNLVAAAKLAVGANPSVRFITAGQGPLEADVAALVAGSGLGDRFRLLGYRSDARDVLAGADVLCVASRHEGLPVAVMEALALGRPVVSTAVGGIPELVRDGVEGLLVPPSDPTALADAVVRIAGDATLRCTLAEGAAARGATIDVERVVPELVARYRRVIGPG